MGLVWAVFRPRLEWRDLPLVQLGRSRRLSRSNGNHKDLEQEV